LGITVECVALFAFIDFPPFRQVFGTASLADWHWLMLLTCPPILIAIEELRKLIVRRNQRKTLRSR
jgi:Ca2+-transporting ATPase